MLDVQILSRLELELERDIYRNSFYEYYKVAFCQLHPGTEYDENWHAKYICDILQEETERVLAGKPREKDIIINVPPRSSKSMIASVIWPTWVWGIDPNRKFLSCSYSADLAVSLSRTSKDLIESAWYQRLYGRKVMLRSDLSGAGHYKNTMGGERYAFGFDGTVTGFGGDFLLVDDPQNPKKADSETERKNTIERYDKTVSNRLNDLAVGSRIIIMQRLHEDDLTGHLMNKKTGRPHKCKHICIPAEYDVETVSPVELKDFYKDNLFWPSRFSANVLEEEKLKGSLYYAGQFGQRPVPPEGNIFKKKWFDILEPEMVSRNERLHPIHFFVDGAYTEDHTERNDPSGILSCFVKDQYLYIVNFVSVWMEFPDFTRFTKEYVELNGYSPGSGIYVEPKATGLSVIQQFKELAPRLNFISIEGEYLRDDKVTRANSISAIAQARKVKIIKGPWNDEFIHQLSSFPKAKHDEAVDLLVYAVLNALSRSNQLIALMA